MIEDPELDRPPAPPVRPAAAPGADAEARIAARSRELDVIHTLGRLAAQAQSPEELFRATIAALERADPIEAALVARVEAGVPQVECHLARPFGADCLVRLSRLALDVLGVHAPATGPQIARHESEGYDPRRDERQDFDPDEAIVVPVLRRGQAAACLVVLPAGPGGESQLRLLYSAANHLGLQLDRLLTAQEDEAERFRAILDTMPQPVVLADAHLAVIHANRSARTLLERLAPQPPGSLGAALERLGIAAQVASVLRERRAVADVEATTSDGTSFSLSISPHPRGLVLVLTDVTESRRLQGRLAQADKLSSLGQMISGTAHELNNPLSSVLGYVQLLRASPAADALAERRLAAIETEAQRCHKIVQNLLAFARHRPPERKPVSINETVRSVLTLLGYQLRTAGIRVTSSLAADLPAVEADTHQLQQVLVNLLTNARQAIRERTSSGEVRLVTERDREGGVTIEVHDDGPGVPAELRATIFDPFFTTKDESQGTGLGLSIVYGIVAGHGGSVEVLPSELGGACFRIALPPRAQAPAPDVPPAVAGVVPRGAAGRILVVDDEPPLLRMLCEALARDGHRTVAAADGEEALERLAEGDFDVIVCDVRMPGMDARRLLEELRARHPGLDRRVLLTSGDTVGREPEELARRHGLELLPKPFGLDELRERVRRMLGRREPA